MAPTAPSKRRSLRAKLAAKGANEPYAPRKAPRPDATVPTFEGFTNTKEDKRLIKRSAFLSRVEKAHVKKNALKRRRPGKKLVANLQSLADALPDLLEDGETEEGLKQLREGKVRHKSMKMKKGALKKKEGIVKGEMERFGRSLAQLTAVGAAGVGSQNQGQGQGSDTQQQSQAESQPVMATPTANRWAVLRGFISSTMEQNPAFVAKQDGR